MTGGHLQTALGLIGLCWAVHLLDGLRRRPERFPGERASVWGLFVCAALLALAGVSRMTGWF